MKIGLKRINMQKEVIVEALLDSMAIRLVISLKFTRKQKFKLKKMERCHMQVHPSGNYISIVISSPNHISLPSTVATFFIIRLMAVL